MNFKGHRNVSAVVSLATVTTCLALGLSPKESMLCGVLTFLGGLFPDLDTHSTPSKWAARFGVLLSLYAVLNDKTELAVYYGFLFMLAKTYKHRGWTHNVFLPVALSFLSYHLKILPYGLAFSFGIYSHLFADSKFIKRINKH